MDIKKTALLELMKDKICAMDKLDYAFALIFENTVDNTQPAIGVITTRALYKNGRGSTSRNEDAVSAERQNMTVYGLVYKYIDGTWVQQTSKVFPYASYSSTNKCNSFYNGVNYVANYKITWSNYPIYYATTINGSATTEEKLNYSTTAPTKLYRNSDEPMTLRRLPVMAEVRIGRYKVGTSEIMPLDWVMADYTDSFTKTTQLENGEWLYGQHNVVLMSSRIIDILPFNDKKDYATYIDAIDANAELYKYMNSKSYDDWWYSAWEGDNRPEPGTFPSGGFLRHFTPQEINLLQNVEVRRNASYTLRSRVHLPSVFEIVDDTNASVNRWRIQDTSNWWYLRPRFHELLRYHETSPQKTAIDKLTAQSKYWKRDTLASGFQTTGESTSGKDYGYTPVAFAPCIYVSQDQEITQTPNEDGKFEIIFPKIEVFDVDYVFSVNRKVVHSVDLALETTRTPACAYEITVPAHRNRVYSSVDVASLVRWVQYNGKINVRYFIQRKIVRNQKRDAQTSRSVIAYRETIVPTVRDVAVRLYALDTVIDTVRSTRMNISYRQSTARKVYILKAFEIIAATKRKTTCEEDAKLDTIRNIMLLTDFAVNTDTSRKIVSVNSTVASASRKILTSENYVLDTLLKTVVDYSFTVNTTRSVRIYDEIDIALNTARQILYSADILLNTTRAVISPINASLESSRQVLSLVDISLDTERHISDLMQVLLCTKRQVLNSEDVHLNATRQVIGSVDVLLDTERQVSDVMQTSLNCERQVLNSEEVYLNTTRQAIVFVDVLLDTERQISYVIQVLLNAERQVLNSEDAHLNTARQVVNLVDVSLDTERQVSDVMQVYLETARQAIKSEHTTIDTTRQIMKEIHASLDTARGISATAEISINAERLVLSEIETSLNTTRQVLQSNDSIYPAQRLVVIDIEENTMCARYIITSSEFVANTERKVKAMHEVDSTYQASRLVISETQVEMPAFRAIVRDFDTEICTERLVKLIVFAENDIETVRKAIVDYKALTASLRHVILAGDILLSTERVVRHIDRAGAVEILRANTVKNDKGISNIEYEHVEYLKCNIYPIKANVETLPVGLSDKAKHLVITKNKTIQSHHYVKLNGVIYGIDMLTKYSIHKEIYLKEL